MAASNTSSNEWRVCVDWIALALEPTKTWWAEAADARRSKPGMADVLPMTSPARQGAAARALEACATRISEHRAEENGHENSADVSARLAVLARSMSDVAAVELEIGIGAFAAAASALEEARDMKNASLAVCASIAVLLPALPAQGSDEARRALSSLDDAFGAFSRLDFALALNGIESFQAVWKQWRRDVPEQIGTTS